MEPFEFIIVFISFVYALGLTHLLLAITRMVRHRRTLVFSWIHALWMFGVLMMVFANWISLWDFHRLETISLPTMLAALILSVMQYLVCALVSPDFEERETYDMRAFNEREGRTYIGALFAMFIVALALNYAAGASLGVKKWSDQNSLAVIFIVPVLLALLVRAAWVQLIGALAFAGFIIAYLVIYYPVLQ